MIEMEEIMLGPITFMAVEEYDSGSATIVAVTTCQQDKQVYVQAQQASDFPYNSYGATLTSFTGFRLYNNDADAIAFSAVLENNVTDPSPDVPMIFSKVLTNIGGAYDPFSGTFTCPDGKLYMFSHTATVQSSILDYIYSDSVSVHSMYCRSRGSGSTSGSCTMSVIIQCEPSKRIHIRGGFVTPRTYIADYTSFSGYKLPGQNNWTLMLSVLFLDLGKHLLEKILFVHSMAGRLSLLHTETWEHHCWLNQCFRSNCTEAKTHI